MQTILKFNFFYNIGQKTKAGCLNFFFVRGAFLGGGEIGWGEVMKICERSRKGGVGVNKIKQGRGSPSFGWSFCGNVKIECPQKYIFDFNVLR